MLSFVKSVLENGGSIHPIVIPAELTNGTGIFNPSVYNDNGKVVVNVRHCQVTLYHAEKCKYEHQWGPLLYMNPENDITLTTTNYFCTLDVNYNLATYHKVDTSGLDVPPIWEFRGLEDCRPVRWNDKLYLCGVRRDTTTNGQGRMELSEIVQTKNGVKEVSRFRIPAPGANDSYCEKNWMPIIDRPFQYVKWTSPTEIVQVFPEIGTCHTLQLGHQKAMVEKELRGGSHVIPFGDYYISLVHEVDLWYNELNRKNSWYHHRFVVWDKTFNLLRVSEPFNFMGAEVEFCAGMCEHNGNILISFGFQDNAAFVLRCPKYLIEDMIS